MIKTYYILSLICATTTTAFLPPLATNTGSSKIAKGNQLLSRSNHQAEADPIPLGRKERYVRVGNSTAAPITVSKLQQECKDLKEQLRHDLLQLKRKQCLVAKEEDTLIQQAVEFVESVDRSVLEQDIVAAEKVKQEVHKAGKQAQKKQRLAAEKWSQNKKSWVDSGGRDLRALFDLGEASAEWKNSQEALEASKEAERQAQMREERAEGILKFLDKQAAALKEISMHPEKEQQWTEEELLSAQHHESLLQVAALEWETEKLWNQLQQDLLELKHLQMQIKKEEEYLVAKEDDIIALQTQEQKEQVRKDKAAMQRARDEVRQAVARKEQAYKGTLSAIKACDADPRLLWKLSESAKYLEESNEAENAAKEVLVRIAAKEPQAEDLLTLLKRTGSFLKELRLPGHEEALEKWVKDELCGHESMLEVVKKELIHSDA